MAVVVAVVILAAVIFGLGRLAIINAERRDAEKKRGDVLQQSINALRARADEEKNFLELIRELLTAQGADEKKALVDQLRNFQFSPELLPSTTTTTTRPGTKSSGATTTTTTPSRTSPTTAPQAPPSTTTTTTAPPPPPKTCVTTPVATICQSASASNNQGKG